MLLCVFYKLSPVSGWLLLMPFLKPRMSFVCCCFFTICAGGGGTAMFSVQRSRVCSISFIVFAKTLLCSLISYPTFKRKFSLRSSFSRLRKPNFIDQFDDGNLSYATNHPPPPPPHTQNTVVKKNSHRKIGQPLKFNAWLQFL